MNKEISTAFLLSPDEDRILRVEAAKVGLSKTKLAQKIIKEWVNSQYCNSTISQRINNIAALISESDPVDKEKLFNALDRVIAGSCDHMEVQVKIGGGVLLGTDKDNELQNRQTVILNKLASEISAINAFCEIEGIALLTKASPEEFADEVVKEYFENRIK